ncbi:MAG: NADPH-dependent F420 reductase [Hyphomicrobiales bacterium]|nr:NADPH-dependent F420 reductase [Hyphomicrobiales bacterium]MBV9518568.1 NADPH-dependent F420 reductase [Hyphomicrobiales bacterium]
MSTSKPTLAIIGGTGALGSGLAQSFAGAGFPVVIGSRTAEKGAEFAQNLPVVAGTSKPKGTSNEAAAQAGDIVFITVPFATQPEIVEAIRPNLDGKLVVDTTVPLMPPKVARVQLPPEDSAAMATQKRLGAGIRVVAGFHNIAAHKLKSGAPIDCDVLIFGDDPKDREIVIGLAKAIGLRALHAGPLANSTAAEALTSVLIGINRAYKVDGAGIRITGIAEA